MPSVEAQEESFSLGNIVPQNSDLNRGLWAEIEMFTRDLAERDGEVYYYDVNALSNFVADAVNVIGFQPHEKLVDFIEEQLAAVSEGSLLAEKI